MEAFYVHLNLKRKVILMRINEPNEQFNTLHTFEEQLSKR